MRLIFKTLNNIVNIIMMSIISDSFIVYDKPQINDSGFSFIGVPKAKPIETMPTINITIFKGDY